MREGYRTLPSERDLTVVEGICIRPHQSQVLDRVALIDLPHLRQDEALGNAGARAPSHLGYRFFGRGVENALECGARELNHVELLEKPVVVSIGREKLVCKGIEAYIILLCLILERFERGFAYTEGYGNCFLSQTAITA